MTKEQAIEVLHELDGSLYETQQVALDLAIKALEQQPSDDCVSRAEVDKLINLYLKNPTIDDSIAFYEHFLDLPPVTPTQRWIPVSEKMPKEGETVLVCYQTQGGIAQSVCEWFYMPNRGIVWSTLCGRTPIAWQPLPKPYEEK